MGTSIVGFERGSFVQIQEAKSRWNARGLPLVGHFAVMAAIVWGGFACVAEPEPSADPVDTEEAGEAYSALGQYGFWDPGFQIALVRTPYISQLEGTTYNPLTMTSCPWSPGESITGCPTGPTVYAQSNYWIQNTSNCQFGYSCNNNTFWIFQNNNEPAFNNCNPGPPNASLPRSSPGTGLMGFTAITGSLPGETFYRAHLVLNMNYANPCNSGYGIPFMSVVADRDRGNNGLTPGALNRSSLAIPNKVKFTARLWDVGVPSCSPSICTAGDYFYETGKGLVDFSLWAVAEWGGVPRMLFLDLLHLNRRYVGGLAGKGLEWNWPIAEDFLQPGADLAFLEVEDLPALCGFSVPLMSGAVGQQITYTIDFQQLFQCASNHNLFRTPLPATANIPIKTVGWKNEGFGTSGGIWTSVHGMQMVP